MFCRRFVYCVLLLTCLFPASLLAQRKITAPLLQRLSRQAGYIFSGTVLSVEKLQPKGPNDVAAVEIVFRVDQAVKGVTAKQTLSIREWAGLWDRSDRYCPGQQILLFLYGSSKLGLTSPVGGDAGRYQVDSTGRVFGNPDRFQELQPPLRTGARLQTINARDLIRLVQRQGGQ